MLNFDPQAVIGSGADDNRGVPNVGHELLKEMEIELVDKELIVNTVTGLMLTISTW